MGDYADLEMGIRQNDVGAYVVEFRLSLPKNDGDIPLAMSADNSVKFDLAELSLFINEPAVYGEKLTAMLYANSNIKNAFIQALNGAQGQQALLRLRLLIGPSAMELHHLRWELLCNPQDNSPLATNQNIIFSRYLYSSDWRPVRLKSKGLPKALVTIANPSGISNINFKEIDIAEEMDIAKRCFHDISLTTCPGQLSEIISTLRNHPADVLYIVCHGFMAENGQSILCLEDAQGNLDKVSGFDFTTELKELQECPRLIVLVSCQSAGKSTGKALTAIGPRLAEIGIPAVLAMQENLSVTTAHKFLPAFFNALQHNDQIDLAVSVARCAVRNEHDAWSPVLFMRLKSGRMWYTPGFSKESSENDFINEVERILEQRCTPIIGPGLIEPLIGSAGDIARKWAEKFHYPLSVYDRDALPKVAQFLATKKGTSVPFYEYTGHVYRALNKALNIDLKSVGPSVASTSKILSELDTLSKIIGEKERANSELNAYRILAKLPFPIYIVANPDCLLEDALIDNNRKPEAILSPWNSALAREKTIFDSEPDYQPSPERPLIFYLFGRWNNPRSMVLTEDEYIKYLIGYTSNKAFVSEDIRSALSETLLLFLGFQTEDWAFRVILNIILGQAGSELLKQHVHVSAQIEPEDDRIIEPIHARKYLEEYFKQGANINIFWGKADEYLAKLVEKWDERVNANIEHW